jgi:hypothetical protein
VIPVDGYVVSGVDPDDKFLVQSFLLLRHDLVDVVSSSP